MWDQIEPRMRDIARRAGVEGVPSQVVAAACVLCAIACVWAVWRWWPRAEQSAPEPAAAGTTAGVAAATAGEASAPAGAGGASEAATAAGRVVVDVAGAVRHPGVYDLAAGSRVTDAIQAAGGATPDAVTRALNLARVLSDGEQILLPDEDEAGAGGVAAGGAAAGVGAGAVARGGAAAGPVNLNTADAALLDTLPGVGPATAAKIVADREANGPFASVDDLGRVSGIGPKKLEEIAGAACVQ